MKNFFNKKIIINNLLSAFGAFLCISLLYRPQFYVRTTDVTGSIIQFTGDDGSSAEMVMPGDRIKMTAELINPVAIEQGMRFAIREGGRTVGAGVISKIL